MKYLTSRSNIISSVLGCSLWLFGCPAFAQVETPANPATTPLPVVSPAADYVSGLTIKYNILDAVSGLHGLYLQPEFAPNFSVEFGIGITRKNILFSGTKNEEDGTLFYNAINSPYWTAPNQSDLEDYFYDYDNRKAKTGFYFSMMPRFSFYSLNSVQSQFIGLKFEYRRYNWTADALLPVSELKYSGKSELKEYEKQTNFLIVYGGRFSAGGFIFEWYGGLGSRRFSLNKRDDGVTYNGSPAVATYGSVLSKYRKTTPMVEFGINIGYRIGGQ